MEQFGIDRVQLHGALAYFYQNREEIQQETEQRIQQVQAEGMLQTNTLERLRQNVDSE